jgi:hypothetical protein
VNQNVGKYLRDFLLADPDVASLVGDRISPNHAGQRPVGVPYAVYHRVSTTRWTTLGGPTNVKKVRIQIDCYAK